MVDTVHSGCAAARRGAISIHHEAATCQRERQVIGRECLVAVADTLRRVEQDLARGDVWMARQRLLGLIAAFPTRLDLRERLAEVYRRIGDRAQAGRWSFLADVRDPTETEAFERAYARDPVRLMRALRWRGPESGASTAVAAERLLLLRQDAERQEKGAVRWEDARHRTPPPTWRGRLVEWALIATAVLVVTLIGIGAVSLLLVGLRHVLAWAG